MDDPSASPTNAAVPAFAALGFGEFRMLVLATFLLHLGLLSQEVALAYNLYLLTHDPLTLGLIGLAEAVPFLSLALFGGHLADRREKRSLMLLSLVLVASASLCLYWLALPATRAQLSQNALLLSVYAVIGLIGVARVFYSPAASSLKAFLVPRALYGNAATWSSAGWQSAAVLGPVFGGLLYSAVGLADTLLVTTVLVALALFCTLGIRPRGVPAASNNGEALWASLKEGIDFVRGSPIIFYAIALDLFSVLFGGVVAILPVFAADVLHIGAQGLGLLRAAPSVGALLTLLVCAWFPPTGQAWRNLLLTIAGFGVATLVFAVSKNVWLSAVALFATGAFDSVSVIIRSTILQVLPPDHLRGRVQSVNSVFISSSNELGAFESGVAARVLGAVPSVIFGGAMTLAIVGGVWARSKQLFRVRLLYNAGTQE